MPRTKGAQDIKGWREHGLLRDLALNEESVEALAEKYEVQPASVYTWRWRNKHRINVVLAEWSNEFSDLWAVKKHARVADLQSQADSLQERIDEMEEDAERATEVMRRVDPDAAPVRVSPLREYRGLIKDKARLLDQIEDSMGQKVQHAGALSDHPGVLGFMGLTAPSQVKAHAKFLALRPDEQTVYRGMPEVAQALFLKLTPVQRDWFPLEGSFREQFEYLQECTELPHQRRERLAMKQAQEESMAKWEAEHPPEQYIAAFAAGLATSEAFRVEVAAELTGATPAKESMLSESVRAQVVSVFADVADLRERLATDDQSRAVVAEMVALDWLGDVPLAEPVSVEEPELVEDETVDVAQVRMMPLLAQEAADIPEVQDEPALVESELPCVEDPGTPPDPVDEQGRVAACR